jgi:uncharacterized protein YjaG (DUF416 family)
VEEGSPPANGGRWAALTSRSQQMDLTLTMTPIELLICRQLGNASSWQRLAFMAACCEPMLSNFRLYNEMTGLGLPETLRKGLDLIWQAARTGQRLPEADLFSLQCAQQSPGWSNRRRRHADAARQACFGIAYSLKTLDGPSIPDVIEVSDAALHSIEWAYRNELKLSDQQREDRSQLLMREYARQVADLELLASADDTHRAIVVITLAVEREHSRANLLLDDGTSVDAETDAIEG